MSFLCIAQIDRDCQIHRFRLEIHNVGAIFLLVWGPVGFLGLLSVIKMTMIYQVHIVTCICCGLSMKINIHKKGHGVQDQSTHVDEDCACILLRFVAGCVVGKYPNIFWNSFADDTTEGCSITCPVSLADICG